MKWGWGPHTSGKASVSSAFGLLLSKLSACTLWLPRHGHHVEEAEGRVSPGKVANLIPGATYYYVLDGEKERPDPVSRCQSEGVHGPSQVTDSAFPWNDLSGRGCHCKIT